MDLFGSDFHGDYQIYLLHLKINDMDIEGYSHFTKAEYFFDVRCLSIAVFVSEVCLSSNVFSILRIRCVFCLILFIFSWRHV